MDSYRGLTVRIGGDTSGLQQALKAANSAAAATQNQLRRIKSAMALDPSSADALQQRLRLVSDRAVDVNSKLSTMRTALRQMDDAGIGRMAEETQNVALRASQAKDAYNAVTTELAKTYNAVERLTKLDPQGNMKLKQMSDEARQAYDEFKKLSGIDLTENQKDAAAVVEKMRELGMVSGETADRVKELVANHRQAQQELDLSKQIAQYADLRVEMTKLESEAASLAREFTAMQKVQINKAMFGGLDNQIENVDAAAKQLEGNLQRVNAALRLNPSDAGAVSLKIQNLAEQSDLAQQKMTLLQQKLAKLRDAGVDKIAAQQKNVAQYVQETEAAYTELQAKIRVASGELERLVGEQKQMAAAGQNSGAGWDQLQTKISQAKAELDKLNASGEKMQSAFETAQQVAEVEQLQTEITETRVKTKELDDALDSMGRRGPIAFSSLKSLGMTAMTTLTPALAAFGAASIDAAVDIDAAFRDMKKTVDGTDSQFAQLRKAAIDFSTTHVTSAEQILEIQSLGGQMGVAVEDLEKFGEVISNLDIATDINAEDAATQLGQLASITGMTSDEYERFGDALVRLGNNMPSQESAIMDISSRIGSMASILGMSVPDILAWSNAIASTGQNSEAAGTAISNTMGDIESAVGAGGDALDAFAEVAGMSAEQFAETWNNRPTEAMKAFIEGLARIDKSGGSVNNTLEGLGITGVRQQQALSGLTQTIGQLDDSLTMSNDAWNGVTDQWGAAGDAAREAQQKSEGFSGAIGKMKNTLKAFQSELGEGAAPIVDNLANAFANLQRVFAGMPDEMKTATVVVGGIAAAAGPALTAISSIGTAWSNLKGKLTPAQKAMVEAARAAAGTADGLEGVKSAAGDAASAASNLTGKQKAMNSVMKVTGGLATLAKGALVGLAIGGITLLISSIADMVQKQATFNDSLRDMAKATEATTSLDTYSANIQGVATGSETAAKSVDELAEAMKASAQTMQQNADDAASQIAQLSAAERIITNYAGQTDLSTDAQGRLRWALQLVNQELGLNISQQDVANGKYTDANGNVQDLTKSLGELIAAKKEEAKANAVSANLTEAYKSQSEAAATLAKSQKEYNDRVQLLMKWNPKLTQQKAEELAMQDSAGRKLEEATKQYDEAVDAAHKYEEQLGDVTRAQSDAADEFDRWGSNVGPLFEEQLSAAGQSLAGLKEDLRGLGANSDDLNALLNPNTDQGKANLDALAQAYDGSATSLVNALSQMGVKFDETKLQAAQAAESIAQTLSGLGQSASDAVANTGMSMDDFSRKMQEAGISSETLAQLGGDNFAKLAEACGYNVDRMIFFLQNYNNVPLLNKDGTVNVDDAALIDAQGNVYKWNGETFIDTKTGSAVVNDTELLDAQGNVWVWNGTELVPKSTTAEVTGNAVDGVAQTQLGMTQDEINQLEDKTVEAQVNGNATSSGTAANIRDVSRAIGGLFSKSVDVVTNFFSVQHAEGGIRRHAAGGIAHRAVPLDIVGENGAEAIVPLTNRRYSQPFVDRIARGVSSEVQASVRSAVDGSRMARNALDWEQGMRDAIRPSVSDVRLEMDQDAFAAAVGKQVRKALADQQPNVNYYLGDTKVTNMSDRDFADAFVRLMQEYGRLART